jgi:hypothetical protein
MKGQLPALVVDLPHTAAAAAAGLEQECHGHTRDRLPLHRRLPHLQLPQPHRLPTRALRLHASRLVHRLVCDSSLQLSAARWEPGVVTRFPHVPFDCTPADDHTNNKQPCVVVTASCWRACSCVGRVLIV